jgi:class 3 adenylate cyclase
VNSGPAVIGNVGALERRSFTAIGDTTNLAARLQAEAEPGMVVIGATTAAELTGAILEPLAPLELKGKSEPVEAFRLIRLG